MSVARKSVFILGGLVVLLVVSLAVWHFGAGGLRPPTSHAASFDLVALAKKARNAVVLIEVFDSSHNEVATGSGFFVSDNGLLITNAHVIENAASAAAKTESGDVLPIKGAIRVERENDLAVLAVEAKNLPFLTLGQSEFLQTGDHVAVIGSPLGLEGSLSEGIISAKRKETDADREWLQITAPISPGSSGSPVLDSSGKVIGIATLVRRDGQSVNFAVPVELAVAMLGSKDRWKLHHYKYENKGNPFAPIPLEVIALGDLLDDNAAEEAVAQSPEYKAALSAVDDAVAAVAQNSLRDELLQAFQAEAAVFPDLAAQVAQMLSKTPRRNVDWKKAADATTALVAKYPKSAIAHRELGKVREEMGFTDQAIEAYQRAVELNPDQPDAWESLGLIYKEKGKATQADFAFSQAIALQQKKVERQRSEGFKDTWGNIALCSLGHLYQSAGNNEAAKGCFLQVMQEDPKGMAALMCQWPLQDVYLSEGNEKAAFDLTYQIMLNPNARHHGASPEAEAWANLSYWYSKHGRDTDGDRCYENAIRLGLKY